jgi:hypothetical protein
MKTAWHWLKNEYIDKWSRIESPEKTHTKIANSLTKEQRQFTRESMDFSINGVGTIVCTATKNKSLDTDLTFYKIDPKQVIDLNTKSKIIKFIELNIGEN